MGLVIRTVIVGLVVGGVAAWLYGGGLRLGWVGTIAIGIGGSFVGGAIASLFSKPRDGEVVHPAGCLMSILGALVLIFALRLFHLL
ncbi:GlsB/YeaQ/YmgE family stress response membrane protein [Sphingomonas sp.]|uniref:GlsB/YeaQ/YmgE family stress response membrane protein n=1 Tax=Sphingomonas sp. TaxID=28214 RepID=UPI001E0E7E6F|nr:GlsB/YeaQ/YmgE family stress response membrane protein [Sphingomonas sp.]MBX9795294.1 GlsB/YeaQ/YmgE family stress response membrane protein [Sphingomonas sp.]